MFVTSSPGYICLIVFFALNSFANARIFSECLLCNNFIIRCQKMDCRVRRSRPRGERSTQSSRKCFQIKNERKKVKANKSTITTHPPTHWSGRGKAAAFIIIIIIIKYFPRDPIKVIKYNLSNRSRLNKVWFFKFSLSLINAYVGRVAVNYLL